MQQVVPSGRNLAALGKSSKRRKQRSTGGFESIPFVTDCRDVVDEPLSVAQRVRANHCPGSSSLNTESPSNVALPSRIPIDVSAPARATHGTHHVSQQESPRTVGAEPVRARERSFFGAVAARSERLHADGAFATHDEALDLSLENRELFVEIATRGRCARLYGYVLVCIGAQTSLRAASFQSRSLPSSRESNAS
jgi:hypothetical protein